MPNSCAKFKCGRRGGGVKMFRFPFQDKERLQKWIKFADRGPKWYPSEKSSRLCVMHFAQPLNFTSPGRIRILNDPVLDDDSDSDDHSASANLPSTKTLSFSNIKITLPSSQSGIACRKDGIYFGVQSKPLETEPRHNFYKEVEVELEPLELVEPRILVPPPTKRPKLQNCIVCQNVAQELDPHKKDDYAKVLMTNVIPAMERGNEDLRNSEIYNFCIPCSNTLEDLQQLTASLQLIQINIVKKIKEIKSSILKSQTVENNELPGVSTFRRIVTTDYIPLNSSRDIVVNENMFSNCKELSKDRQNVSRKRKVRSISPKDPLEGIRSEDEIIKSKMTESFLKNVHCEEEQAVVFNPWENSPFTSQKERPNPNNDILDRDCLMYVNPKVKVVRPKPPLDYQQLCILGIVSVKSRILNVSDLYNFIRKHFPFFKSNSEAKVIVKKTVSTSDVFQLVNYEAFSDSTIKEKQNRSSYIPFWTVVETKVDEYRSQLVEILGSPELTKSLSSSEMAQTLITKVSEKVSQINPVDSSESRWKRWNPPPFSYRQIIFFCLVNQSAPVSTSQIINYFKETFPYFSLLRDWDYGVFFNLQSEYFIEEDISPSPISRRLAYSINPSKVEELKESLINALRTVDTSQLNPKNFMRKPENLQDILNSTAIILKLEKEECDEES